MSTYVFTLFTFLSARRRTLGLSPADLAARCDLTPDTIERVAQGRFLPSPSQAYQMVLALGLDPVDLGRWSTNDSCCTRSFSASTSLRPPADLLLIAVYTHLSHQEVSHDRTAPGDRSLEHQRGRKTT